MQMTRSPSTGIGSPAPVHQFPELGFLAPDLRRVEEHLDGLVQSVVPQIPRVGRYLLRAGGKRLRPMLTLLSARLAAAEQGPVGLAAVGEMIHLASLLHDDVVDEGVTRRGQPTANRAFGNGLVVLVGDFCLASALKECTSSGVPGVTDALARAVTEMAEGEVLQLQHVGRLDTPIDIYMSVIEKKSAALISWCCLAGGKSGDQRSSKALADYGRSLGIAFQIADDILDYAGQESETGKAIAADLRGLKLTLPLLIAVEREPGLRPILERAWNEGLSDSELGRTAAAVVQCGAMDAARAIAREHSQRAIEALADIKTETEQQVQARRALVELATYVVERKQ